MIHNNIKIGELTYLSPYPVINIAKNIKPISSVMEAKSYDWIVEDLFAKEYISVLFGEPGCGKTWLILDMALSLSNGTEIFNFISVDKTKVLLIEGDAPDSIIKERITKFHCSLDDDYFKYVNKFNLEQEGNSFCLSENIGRDTLKRIIEESKAEIVIIDTLISFINDEKDAETVRVVMDFLRTLAKQNNCHIMIVHHSRKRESGQIRNKLDQSDVIGSSIITRLASIVIGVDKYGEQ